MLQRVPLNGIRVNGIIGLTGVKLNQICQSQINLLHLIYVSSSFAYLYHSVNGITLGLAQSVPVKRLSLYKQIIGIISNQADQMNKPSQIENIKNCSIIINNNQRSSSFLMHPLRLREREQERERGKETERQRDRKRGKF